MGQAKRITIYQNRRKKHKTSSRNLRGTGTGIGKHELELRRIWRLSMDRPEYKNSVQGERRDGGSLLL